MIRLGHTSCGAHPYATPQKCFHAHAGVQGQGNEKGELFGLSNLFKETFDCMTTTDVLTRPPHGDMQLLEDPLEADDVGTVEPGPSASSYTVKAVEFAGMLSNLHV